jgi:SAM-dependent methyltransferase
MRMKAYIKSVAREQLSVSDVNASAQGALGGGRQQRWEVYRALSEPIRLKLLALSSRERLSIGELAEVLGEGQPNVSWQVAQLRQVGLLTLTKQGTRSFVERVEDEDALLADARASGTELCEQEGCFAKVEQVLLARDRASLEYFAESTQPGAETPFATLRTYLAALGELFGPRGVALDVGTGDGELLEVLSPFFRRVVGVDRSAQRLASARARLVGVKNVELVQADSAQLAESFAGKVDMVFASRFLHHAPKPLEALGALGALLAPGGTLALLDYREHDDDAMRSQADLWLGFAEEELTALAMRAGFAEVKCVQLPSPRSGVDAHLPWQILVARGFLPRDERGGNRAQQAQRTSAPTSAQHSDARRKSARAKSEKETKGKAS